MARHLTVKVVMILFMVNVHLMWRVPVYTCGITAQSSHTSQRIALLFDIINGSNDILSSYGLRTMEHNQTTPTVHIPHI